jgi:membrane-associated protein
MGYLLEKVNPDVDKYLLPIILIIIVVSLLPSLIHIYQEHKSNRP